MNGGDARQAVGLLGGSFDPVHNGHTSIARSFVESGYLSELWVLLTPESPHKGEREFTDYRLRLAMLTLAFEAQENILASEVEKRLSPPYYTLQTIQYLTGLHEDKKFYLCMGEDSLGNFHKWHGWEEILRYCELLAARRPLFQPEKLNPKISKKTRYIDHEPVEISSTQVRNNVHKGIDITGLVPRGVARIIHEHQLYR